MKQILAKIENRMLKTLLHRFIGRQIEADSPASSMLVDCAITLIDEVRP